MHPLRRNARGPSTGLAALVLLALTACGPNSQQDRDGAAPDGATSDSAVSDGATPDAAVTDGQVGDDSTAPDGGTPCPTGLICVSSYPYHDDNDTSASLSSSYDAYGCMPSVDESGPEVIYRLEVPTAGFLSAAVPDDVPGVDIDLHLLGSLNAADCIDRGHYDVGAHVQAGTYYLIADSYVDNGTVMSGPYALDVGFIVPPVGDCSMTTDVVDRLWGPSVTLPDTGPMVLEAHLVTVDDPVAQQSSWPTSLWDGIPTHHQLSMAATGFIMGRTEPWCPQESSEFGQGATGQYVPVEGEGWYINMLWANRPAAGTRMIVQLPGGGPAVVAAAGYETGPGDTNHLGGITEEIHFYLGTGHLDDLTIGFAADQTLPLGPISCQ